MVALAMVRPWGTRCSAEKDPQRKKIRFDNFFVHAFTAPLLGPQEGTGERPLLILSSFVWRSLRNQILFLLRLD